MMGIIYFSGGFSRSGWVVTCYNLKLCCLSQGVFEVVDCNCVQVWITIREGLVDRGGSLVVLSWGSFEYCKIVEYKVLISSLDSVVCVGTIVDPLLDDGFFEWGLFPYLCFLTWAPHSYTHRVECGGRNAKYWLTLVESMQTWYFSHTNFGFWIYSSKCSETAPNQSGDSWWPSRPFVHVSFAKFLVRHYVIANKTASIGHLST
jgi:hypothetical protein